VIEPFILLVVLILLNGIFASAELAVLSMNETKLKVLTAEGDVRAKKLSKLTEQPARFLATIQVAITLAGLLQSAFAAENFAEPLVGLIVSWGVTIPVSILKTIAIIVITIILAYFTLVFGELVPKRIAMKKSESLALGLARLLYAVAKMFAPVVWFLTVSTNFFLRLLGIDPNEEDEQVTREEIKMMVSESNEQGNIEEEEKEIIQNVFDFNDISVGEICTHRRDVVLLYMEDSEEEWDKVICENRHTLYPVCGETPDEILAILDSRDYFRMEDKSREKLMELATDKPYFIPETKRANKLFQEMKERRTYFAVLIDEYGSMVGIITLHDLVESLMGEISEEDDPEVQEDITQIADGEWCVYGSALMRDVETETGLELAEDDYDTFSGFICGIIERVPQDDEQFSCETEQISIEVLEVKNHIVGKTIVRLIQKEEAELN
jgi:putative hemolysin